MTVRSMLHVLVASLVVIPSATAYIRYAPLGAPLTRADFANIHFRVNDAAVAGLTNADGQVFISSNSDATRALKSAIESWSSIPTSAVRFAPLETTTKVNDPSDGVNVFVFRDTPEIRSVIGSAVAINLYSVLPGGQIADTDILFSPTRRFSTTMAAGTYDIESIAAHELGHALGANHSGILSATMFHATQPGQISQRRLSADDTLFASVVYPAPGPNPFGTISGRLTMTDGSPFRGGLVTAIDAATGIAIGALSSLVDGSYSFQAPAGDYFISAEPLGGAVQPGNLYLTTADTVDTALQPGFAGGVDTPAILSVATGSVVNGDLTVIAGASSLKIQFTTLGPAGGQGESLLFSTGPRTLRSGEPVDLLVAGPGLDANLTDQNVRIVGPGAKMRPNSVRVDPSMTVNGMPVLRITLDVEVRLSTAAATLVIGKDGNTAVFSGGLVLSPTQ
ncbi:MAG: matrixin family metalloprotease [Acidobacteriota bacterium]|nr:matrixin family metalloprotease [Acidobacteriota bacterium]